MSSKNQPIWSVEFRGIWLASGWHSRRIRLSVGLNAVSFTLRTSGSWTPVCLSYYWYFTDFHKKTKQQNVRTIWTWEHIVWPVQQLLLTLDRTYHRVLLMGATASGQDKKSRLYQVLKTPWKLGDGEMLAGLADKWVTRGSGCKGLGRVVWRGEIPYEF